MNAKYLITHFDRVSEALGANRRFRELIVQLAVRGQLVRQEPDEGSAEALISGIQSQKAVVRGRGRANKPEPVSADEIPYPVPTTWAWARTDDLCESIVDCPHSTPQFVSEGIVCLDTNAFKEGALVQDKVRYVSEETFRERVKRLTPQGGDIVFAREGSVGQSVVIPEGMKCCLGQRVMLFRPGRGVDADYFRFAISEQSALDRLMSLHKGIGARHVNVGDMRRVLIPVPPEAEQRRIVAKVDELMRLCDELEEAQTNREGRRDRVASASQRRIVETISNRDPFRESVSFYLGRLHRLVTRDEHISEIRHTILDVAVRGALVAPELGDEPVGQLMGRLREDVARRKASGEYADPQRSFEIPLDDLPFAIPSRWDWARLVEVAHVSYGFAFASSRFNSDKRGMPLIRIRDISKDDTEAYFDGDFDDYYLVHEGDYLVGMDGDFNVRKWRGPDALLNQRVARIKGWRLSVVPELCAVPLQMILKHLHSSTSQTTVKHLSAKQMNGIYLPMPPIEEQQRIVAKVEELMAICDELEAQLREGSTKSSRLLEAVLYETLHSVA